MDFSQTLVEKSDAIDEWMNQGNVEDSLRLSEVRILIILDNASYHKKKDILEKIEQ